MGRRLVMYLDIILSESFIIDNDKVGLLDLLLSDNILKRFISTHDDVVSVSKRVVKTYFSN